MPTSNDEDPRMDAVLDRVVSARGVLGAAIVRRDGVPLRASGRLARGRGTFGAMTATGMGALELALGELDGGTTHHLVLTTDRIKLIVVPATRDLLLVACTQADEPHERLLPNLEAGAQSVALLAPSG